jgi:TetR/AcrR family transcriptional repressor of mexJK operon
MSAIEQPAPEDPRVTRSRAAALEAARTLFLKNGYTATTMEEVAALARLSKRTLYNLYPDKKALFTEVVSQVIAYAQRFAENLITGFEDLTAAELPTALHDLARRQALAILRPDVIALRRLLIREARSFPELAGEYFEAAPGRVLTALAATFQHLTQAGLLHTPDPRRAAEHFAYLIAGAPLDRAMLLGKVPPEAQVTASAQEGVETFLARYG